MFTITRSSFDAALADSRRSMARRCPAMEYLRGRALVPLGIRMDPVGSMHVSGDRRRTNWCTPRHDRVLVIVVPSLGAYSGSHLGTTNPRCRTELGSLMVSGGRCAIFRASVGALTDLASAT